MSREASPARRLAPVASLRFFAAGLIVLHHSRGLFGIPDPVGEYFNFAQAVSFFFVMSGFVLAYVYPSLNGRANRAQFFLARIARLWPLHIAMFLLAVALIPWKDLTSSAQSSTGIALTNLFLVQAWIPVWSYMFSFNATFMVCFNPNRSLSSLSNHDMEVGADLALEAAALFPAAHSNFRVLYVLEHNIRKNRRDKLGRSGLHQSFVSAF